MNERIEELTQEAADSTRVAHNNAYWRMMDEIPEDKTWREKFAELIIKECIKVCNSRVGNSDYNTGRMHCASDIKDHFGVE